MPKADPLTPVRRQRLQEWCRAKGLELPGGRWNTNAVAVAIGKSVTKASNLLNGTGSFGSKIAREIEETAHMTRGYLDGMGETEEFVDVARVASVVAAGAGAEPVYEEVIGHLKFTREFLRSCGVLSDGARVVDVSGHSMDPTIKDGAVLLVNTRHREPADNAIFALYRPSEGLIVKRLVRLPTGWVARSDNRDFEDIRIDDGEPIAIVGRALWMGAKL